MRDEIYWVVACSVRDGKFEDFKQVAASLTASTFERPGCLAYDYSVNDDSTLVHIFEAYRDSDAVISHITQTFPRFADAFTECVSVDGFVVYGEPTPAAREVLDGRSSVYMSPFEGFTRTSEQPSTSRR